MYMDHVLKLRQTIDALFGKGVSKNLPKDVVIVFSKKTGRIKTVHYKENLLCTLRIDGGLAITPYFAQLLLKSKKFKENCLEINKDAAPFVQEGRSVFCKHVIWCGKNIQISSDTPVIFQNRVIAVGRAVLSSEMIVDFERGVAVKVRDSLKSRTGEIAS
jgi:uncharacterized protein with predicted RNA binding PUA domain